MKVLVTGATGHVGANLVRRLVEMGSSVRVFIRRTSDPAAIEGLDVERVYGDLRDSSSVTAAVRGCEQIFHCAAKVSLERRSAQLRREIFETNVLGTVHLLRSARACGVSRVVVTSSQSAVGHRANEVGDEAVPLDPFATRLPYGASKIFAEYECLKAFADGLDVVIAVSTTVLGPNDFKPSRIGQLLLDFAARRLRAYIDGGFECIAARDLVSGHLLAMAKGRSGQRYLFSSEYLSTKALLTEFAAVTGRPIPGFRLSPALVAGLAWGADLLAPPGRSGRERRLTLGALRLLRARRRVDCAKAKDELGFCPTSVRVAIHEAHVCFARRGMLPNCGTIAAGGLPGRETRADEKSLRSDGAIAKGERA